MPIILRSTILRHSHSFLYYKCMIAWIGIAHQMWFVDFQQPLTEWHISFFVTVFGSFLFTAFAVCHIFYMNTRMMYFTDEHIQVLQKHIYGVTSNIVIRKIEECLEDIYLLQAFPTFIFSFTDNTTNMVEVLQKTIMKNQHDLNTSFNQIKNTTSIYIMRIRFKRLQEERRKNCFRR